MPYFMRKERDKYCVFKGTSNDPGELVKCHDDEDKASAHLRALMANVDDSKVPKKVPHKLPKKGVDLPSPATTGPAEWESMKAEDIMAAVGKQDELVTNDEQDKNDTEEKALSIDGYTDKIRDSFNRHFSPRDAVMAQPIREDMWVREVFPSYVVAQKDGDFFRIPYTADAEGNATFAEPSLWTKVEQEWVESKSHSDRLIVYKSGDIYRWLAIANVAMWDREDERLTDKAYDDAVEYGSSHGYGELDLVHVDGTDVGTSDLMLRMGTGEESKLVMGGQWYNDSRAVRARKSVQARPDYFGTSIKFVYDPKQFVEGVYHGGIYIKKCTILPRHMAASHGTAIAVLGGEQKMKELDQETKDALADIGATQEEIEEASERSKSLPDEVNVKTKEGESFLDHIKSLISNALTRNKTPEQETATPDVVEQSKTETEVAPVETTQDTEDTEGTEKSSPDVEESTPVENPVASEEVVKAIVDVAVQTLAPSIKEAVQPLSEALSTIAQRQEAIEKRLLETEKDIETKVVEKLAAQPPVVKVRPTELKQNEDITQPTITDSPASNFSKEFMAGVSDIVSRAMKDHLNMPEIKLSE